VSPTALRGSYQVNAIITIVRITHWISERMIFHRALSILARDKPSESSDTTSATTSLDPSGRTGTISANAELPRQRIPFQGETRWDQKTFIKQAAKTLENVKKTSRGRLATRRHFRFPPDCYIQVDTVYDPVAAVRWTQDPQSPCLRQAREDRILRGHRLPQASSQYNPVIRKPD
jgi:hypothetical protein